MKDSLKPKILAPKNALVKKHIAYYYFFSDKHESSHFEFWHYPHYQTSLVFFKNAEIREDEVARYINSTDEDKLQCIFNNNLIGAKKEVLQGKFSIIGLVFHPLGIKHFQNINPIVTDRFFALGLNEVFEAKDEANRVQKLDEIFERLHQDFHAPVINRAVEIIINRRGDVYLNELAELLNTSRRTILRNFRAHLNCSFQDFKNVVKFRKAVEQNNQNTRSNKLSDLAYDLNYYDQSDFIKAFKSMTNETPKKLLPQVRPVSEKLVWKYPQG